MAIWHPWMKVLPLKVQKLVGAEMLAGEADSENRDFRQFAAGHEEGVSCDCQFYRRFSLLCRHVWAHHKLMAHLKQSNFEGWTNSWTEAGFEQFFDLEQDTDSVAEEEDNAHELEQTKVQRQGKVKETTAWVQERYYELEEQFKDDPCRAEIMAAWFRLVDRSLVPVYEAGAAELRAILLNEGHQAPLRATYPQPTPV